MERKDERQSVVVVDDHALFRAGVIQCLEMEADLKVVGEGSSRDEAVRLARDVQPNVMLLDISMPGNGIDAAVEILRDAPRTKIVMLTVSEEDDDIVRSLEVGAAGYLLKGISSVELLAAVRSVAGGHSFVSPSLAVRILSGMTARLRPGLLSSLSRQEKRTLELVSMGMSNREVGKQLGILEKTVKFHMSRILKKLGVRNRVEASLLAQQEWGQVKPK